MIGLCGSSTFDYCLSKPKGMKQILFLLFFTFLVSCKSKDLTNEQNYQVGVSSLNEAQRMLQDSANVPMNEVRGRLIMAEYCINKMKSDSNKVKLTALYKDVCGRVGKPIDTLR
jgi:hypothetical protein